jgi:hypothetical protein
MLVGPELKLLFFNENFSGLSRLAGAEAGGCGSRIPWLRQ